MKFYSFDFETTTDIKDCRVWAWGAYEIYSEEFNCGTTIRSFLEFVETIPMQKVLGSFHNLKFDGEFIIYDLFKQGYEFTLDRDPAPRQFTALIGEMGQFYSMKVGLPSGKILDLIDSLKVWPYSVEELAGALNIEEKKGNIDYDEYRSPDHELTEEEKGYLKNDVVIAGKAMKYAHQEGDTYMTAGANALGFYRSQIGSKTFKKWFPTPSKDVDAFIRKSYRGGWTYANPKFQNRNIGEGLIFDVNSLYPSRMRYCLLPYGEEKYYIGQYCEDKARPLYVQRIRCSFKIRKKHFPTIQLKGMLGYSATEYVESTEGDIVELTLTSVDLKLFLEQYEVDDLEYVDGYSFRASLHMFDEYIDYWMDKKIEAGKTGNKPLRTQAKLKMNSLYGKFAKKQEGQRKIPYLDEEEDRVRYYLGEMEDQGGLYIPMGTFITAYARDFTIRGAQACYDRFLYADTDSLHLKGLEIPDNLEVDDYELGKWKCEGKFRKARYLGAKCYIEDVEVSRKEIKDYLDNYPLRPHHVDIKEGEERGYKISITCAGLPDKNKDDITYDNFLYGLEIYGKLAPRHVAGGIVLEKTSFEIKPRMGNSRKKKTRKNVSRETYASEDISCETLSSIYNEPEVAETFEKHKKKLNVLLQSMGKSAIL